MIHNISTYTYALYAHAIIITMHNIVYIERIYNNVSDEIGT